MGYFVERELQKPVGTLKLFLIIPAETRKHLDITV